MTSAQFNLPKQQNKKERMKKKRVSNAMRNLGLVVLPPAQMCCFRIFRRSQMYNTRSQGIAKYSIIFIHFTSVIMHKHIIC